MNANNKSSKAKVDVKIILSALWGARVFSGLQGDSTRLHDPVALNELLTGTADIVVTDLMFVVLSAILAIPIIMSVLSLTLKDKANRWFNLITGIFFVVWDLGFMVFMYSQDALYEIFWGIAYLIFVSLVVWYAWKWPKQEA
jgi:heme A synthase